MLFIKPDWVVIIDDIEGAGAAEILWQAHTEERAPEIDGSTATVAGERARARLMSLHGPFAQEKHPVAGMDKTVHLLTVPQAGPLPLRSVVLVHLTSADSGKQPSYQRLSEEGSVGVEFSADAGREHVVKWEPRDARSGRFVTWVESVRGEAVRRFFASDGNESTALDGMLTAADARKSWNGRALLTSAENVPTITSNAALDPNSVEAFTYHGRPEMTPVGVAGRVVWRTKAPARHSVLYRRTGSHEWLREHQPDLYRLAWVLLPDLTPGVGYELKLVSELESGRVLESPVFQRRAPEQ